uniref:Agenet-like domain-containing protein n=1 Tax=Opuntia streptacantha TaxID=393608 RepID=A0A7C9E8Y5_OPUST
MLAGLSLSDSPCRSSIFIPSVKTVFLLCFQSIGASLKLAIMRFNIGMKVEVLTEKKVPSGVWRCAEIVVNDGDSYTIRYYSRPGVLSEVVEKVSVETVSLVHQ